MSPQSVGPRHSAPGEPSPAARNLTEWFRQFDRLLRSARGYGADAAPVQQLRVRVIEGLLEALRFHAPLVLRVSPLEIFLRDEILVCAPHDDDESEKLAMDRRLPFQLYRDGIRGITLPENTSEADIERFVDAAITMGAGAASDQDLVTLLWEAQLEHIRIDAATLEQSLARQDISLDASPALDAANGDRQDAAQPTRPECVDDRELPRVGVDVLSAWETLQAEADNGLPALQHGLRTAGSAVWAEAAETFLRQVLAKDPSAATRTALSTAAIAWLASAIDRCAWDEAARAESLLREIDTDLSASSRTLQQLLAGLDHAAISERLDEADAATITRFFALLVRLGTAATDLAVGIMARAARPRLRAAATTALTFICNDQPNLLAPALYDSRWHVVRNVVFVLGQIGGPAVGDLLAVPARHLDGRVRRAVITAVAQVPQQQRIPILLGQLDSNGPPTLHTVLAMLGRESDPRVAQALLSRIDAPDFETRPDDVKVALLGTLGDVADDAAVPALEALLQKGGWFARRSIARTAAAQTLARIGTAAALTVLHQGSQSHGEAVRTACLDALAPVRAA